MTKFNSLMTKLNAISRCKAAELSLRNTRFLTWLCKVVISEHKELVNLVIWHFVILAYV